MTAGCLPTSACLCSAACCVLALFLVSLHMANRRLAAFCVLVWCSVWAHYHQHPVWGLKCPLMEHSSQDSSLSQVPTQHPNGSLSLALAILALSKRQAGGRPKPS